MVPAISAEPFVLLLFFTKKLANSTKGIIFANCNLTTFYKNIQIRLIKIYRQGQA